MKNTIRTILLLMSVFTVLTLVISVIVYFSISKHLENDFYKLLDFRAKSVAKWQLDQHNGNRVEDGYDKLFHESDFIFSVNDDMQLVVDSLHLDVNFIHKIVQESYARYSSKGLSYVGITHVGQLDGQKYIVISRAENYLEGKLSIFLSKLLTYTFIGSILVGLLLSYFLSRYLFKPIVKMTERVKQMTSENLHLRLPIKKIVNDEVNELAHTFNTMLSRLETAFEIQNNFISNASHELRTPLTSIIGEADLALSKERSAAFYQETLTVILEEAEKLDGKTKALLALAQTGFNGKIQSEEILRIDQLIWDTKELVEKLDLRHKIVFNSTLLPENPLKLKVKGSFQLLQLAISNIITNSSKYSNYQEVIVSVGASDDNVYIVINDTGIGIPTNELKYIYDPFFRASNTRSYEGYGIGLPLTKNIIELHNGSIEVNSNENVGTIVKITLPVHQIRF